MTDPWATVDPVGEALHFLRMSGTFYSRAEFSAPWGLELPPMPGCMMFHVVTAGRCWLEVPGTEPVALSPGSLALVPHGRGHRLSSRPGGRAAPLFDLPRQQVSERYDILRHGGGGEGTAMFCGAVRFDHPAALRLAGLLPRRIVVEAADAPGEWLDATLRLMAAEARALRPGGEAVITRLADVLVIQAIRSWMARDPAARGGWLGALQDGSLGRALALVHREPEREWTLGSLARAAGLSRSAFAARFTAMVGEPAMRYVLRWRMHLALGLLREDRAGLAELAGRLGYRSEAAFCRAFKRTLGLTPGAARRGAELPAPAAPAAPPPARRRRRRSPSGRRAVRAPGAASPTRRGAAAPRG